MKKTNRTTLVGSLIYLGIGVVSLAAYFIDKNGGKLRIFSVLKKRRSSGNNETLE